SEAPAPAPAPAVKFDRDNLPTQTCFVEAVRDTTFEIQVRELFQRKSRRKGHFFVTVELDGVSFETRCRTTFDRTSKRSTYRVVRVVDEAGHQREMMLRGLSIAEFSGVHRRDEENEEAIQIALDKINLGEVVVTVFECYYDRPLPAKKLPRSQQGKGERDEWQSDLSENDEDADEDSDDSEYDEHTEEEEEEDEEEAHRAASSRMTGGDEGKDKGKGKEKQRERADRSDSALSSAGKKRSHAEAAAGAVEPASVQQQLSNISQKLVRQVKMRRIGAGLAPLPEPNITPATPEAPPIPCVRNRSPAVIKAPKIKASGWAPFTKKGYKFRFVCRPRADLEAQKIVPVQIIDLDTGEPEPVLQATEESESRPISIPELLVDGARSRSLSPSARATASSSVAGQMRQSSPPEASSAATAAAAVLATATTIPLQAAHSSDIQPSSGTVTVTTSRIADDTAREEDEKRPNMSASLSNCALLDRIEAMQRSMRKQQNEMEDLLRELKERAAGSSGSGTAALRQAPDLKPRPEMGGNSIEEAIVLD
ncbi:hypothetical protein OC835_004943, partial [Tilletia horrida]